MSDKEFLLAGACLAALFAVFYGIFAALATSNEARGFVETAAHCMRTEAPILMRCGASMIL